MFVEFFIRRPVFASCLRAADYSGGRGRDSHAADLAVSNLAPPQVGVTSFYTGASAQTVESAVTIPLEQQINGAEGMKYITSTSGNDGPAPLPPRLI